MYEKFKKEFEEFKKYRSEVFSGEDAWVKGGKWEEDNLIFKVDLDYSEEYRPVTVIVPESGKVFNIVRGDDCKEMISESFTDLLRELFNTFEKEREEALEALATPGTAGVANAFNGDNDDSEVYDDVDEEETIITPDGNAEDEEIQSRLLEINTQLNKVKKTNGWNGFCGAAGAQQIRIYLVLNPRTRLKISELVGNAWGIDLDKYIVLALTFTGYYTDYVDRPTVEAFQSGHTADKVFNTATVLDNKVKFGLYWTIEQLISRDFFVKYWPIEKYKNEEKSSNRNYMESLLAFVEESIKTSPGRCIICGDKLPHLGLKPTVCDKQLCVFSHEQYGLGVDLESAIKKYPEIVDLMITMCNAAALHTNYRFNPFNPYPMGLEVKIRNDKGEMEIHNFLDDKGERQNQKVKAVLDLIPSLDTLSQWVDQGKLKENCDKKHPLLYGLLRWIMASNRSHLKKLEPNEQLAEMKTSHQYLMMSSPPEKEKRFQELKKKYGSVYCFHGSALGNWHSIMRVGLKNMSGTDGQVNGAAYGNGVYMAPHSSTSAGYMRFYQGWANSSTFKGSLGCMAVCELITKKNEVKPPNPHYVVPNEELIQTRYFMIYESNCSANVDGAKLKPPIIDWS